VSCLGHGPVAATAVGVIVAEAAGAVPDGVVAGEMATHEDEPPLGNQSQPAMATAIQVHQLAEPQAGLPPAQALRDPLGITELPPLVSPERQEVEPTAA